MIRQSVRVETDSSSDHQTIVRNLFMDWEGGGGEKQFGPLVVI